MDADSTVLHSIVHPPLNSAGLCAGLFLWQFLLMDIKALETKIQLLKILADDCKKHPAYRAIRPATGNCEPCVNMWKARLELNDMEKQC